MCVCHVFVHVGLSERAILYTNTLSYVAMLGSRYVCPENVLQIHFTSGGDGAAAASGWYGGMLF